MSVILKREFAYTAGLRKRRDGALRLAFGLVLCAAMASNAVAQSRMQEMARKLEAEKAEAARAEARYQPAPVEAPDIAAVAANMRAAGVSEADIRVAIEAMTDALSGGETVSPGTSEYGLDVQRMPNGPASVYSGHDDDADVMQADAMRELERMKASGELDPNLVALLEANTRPLGYEGNSVAVYIRSRTSRADYPYAGLRFAQACQAAYAMEAIPFGEAEIAEAAQYSERGQPWPKMTRSLDESRFWASLLPALNRGLPEPVFSVEEPIITSRHGQGRSVTFWFDEDVRLAMGVVEGTGPSEAELSRETVLQRCNGVRAMTDGPYVRSGTDDGGTIIIVRPVDDDEDDKEEASE